MLASQDISATIIEAEPGTWALEVAPDEYQRAVTAIRLYRKFGYHISGTWGRYYQDGEDALIMEKIRL